ncbi:MAG: ligase-associated DNA damage response DEXH box helicase, partial [Bacteroidota bacterium]
MVELNETDVLLDSARSWFKTQAWAPFPFQVEAWQAYLRGESGLVNAPTGSGKTYSLVMPILLEALQEKGNGKRQKAGIRAVWLSPIRALTREIQRAAQRAADDLGLDWTVAIRSGDTSSSDRQKQMRKPPEMLITTPESLHLLLASKKNRQLFGNLRCVVADEWHELLGSKRGVQVELALSRLRALRPELKTWGISATIGNLEEAMLILLGHEGTGHLIRSGQDKQTKVVTVIPDEIETFPWAGHLGITLLQKVVPIIQDSGSTLIFTNTRAQCEIWYQRLLEAEPDLAGAIAMHHGSLDRKLRDWVENALHEGSLKAVVCTSSLDLGVDFRPVETIVQIGSPKGVARFLQRAGRSGHRPGATSIIHFVPTHSMELIEAGALKAAMKTGRVEDRIPYIRSFDVLVQYLVTLAVGGGFRPAEVLPQIRSTYAFASLSDDEWSWCLDFIVTGGSSLEAYDEYRKVIVEDGLYKVDNRRVATMHRLSIGAITSEQVLRVKYLTGGTIGTIEEYWVSQLSPGDTFWFAGRNLELVRIRGMEVQVRKSRSKKGKVPAWLGSRMDLSSHLATHLRDAVDSMSRREYPNEELAALDPLIEIQMDRSAVPNKNQLLIEYFKDREGWHLLMYPFEGRSIHEGLSALMAYRLG